MPNPGDNSFSTTVCNCKTQVKQNVLPSEKDRNFISPKYNFKYTLSLAFFMKKQMVTVAKEGKRK